jgi:hypothetical protein
MKRVLIVLVVLTTAFSARAQFFELGAGMAGTYLRGDVGAQTLLPTDFAGNISLRRQYNWHWGTRVSYTHGFLKADDAWSNKSVQQARDIAVRTEVGEFSGVVEFNYWPYATGSKFDKSFYLFAGLAFTAYTPRGLYNDQWYDLRALGTEGQGTELSNTLMYNDLAIAVPMGIGYRHSISRDFSFAAEIGWRRYGTDFIDDTSGKYVDSEELGALRGLAAAHFANPGNVDYVQGLYRGTPETNDWSIFAGLTIFYNLSPRNERCDGF